MSVKDAYYIQDGEMVSSEGRWRLTFDKNKGTTLKGHGAVSYTHLDVYKRQPSDIRRLYNVPDSQRSKNRTGS